MKLSCSKHAHVPCAFVSRLRPPGSGCAGVSLPSLLSSEVNIFIQVWHVFGAASWTRSFCFTLCAFENLAKIRSLKNVWNLTSSIIKRVKPWPFFYHGASHLLLRCFCHRKKAGKNDANKPLGKKEIVSGAALCDHDLIKQGLVLAKHQQTSALRARRCREGGIRSLWAGRIPPNAVWFCLLTLGLE